MKPFDLCIYEKFPGAFAGSVPERPWWAELRKRTYLDDQLFPCVEYVRSDGKVADVFVAAPGFCPSSFEESPPELERRRTMPIRSDSVTATSCVPDLDPRRK